jgi:hypothetical protein
MGMMPVQNSHGEKQSGCGSKDHEHREYKEDEEDEEEHKGLSPWIWLLIGLGVYGFVSVALIYGLEIVLSYLVVI